MQIGVIGACENSCPLYLREKITQAFERLASENSQNFSFVLLSTCRRVELYFSSQDLTGTHVKILQILRELLQTPFEHVLFSLFESECFFHLMKVTAGLDSSITGESEIQKQVKIAYEKSKLEKTLPTVLHFAFQKSLKVGKDMRTSFEFFKRQNSLAHIILSQLKLLSSKPFKEQSVLFIGNSQINRHMLPVFFGKNFKKIILCSKYQKPSLFHEQPNFSLANYEAIKTSHQFDAVICATKASKYLIKKEQLKNPSQVLFDLSIPRNIDPKIKHFVPLFNIEELGSLFEEKKKLLKTELSKCENAVAYLTERYQKIYKDKLEKKAHYLKALLKKTTV